MTTNNTLLDELGEFTILLVDDDLQIQDLLSQAAKNEFPQGKFVHKTSFKEATDYLENLTGWGPRLILLDIDLKQDKNGLDVLAWIRDNKKYSLLPVVILSVIHEDEVVREAYAKGANIFTNKPFTFEEWKAYIQYLRTYWFAMASTPKLWLDNPASSATN